LKFGLRFMEELFDIVSDENPGSPCGFQRGNTCLIHAVMNAYTAGMTVDKEVSEEQHDRLDEAIAEVDPDAVQEGMTIGGLQKLCRKSKKVRTVLQGVIGDFPCPDFWEQFMGLQLKKKSWEELSPDKVQTAAESYIILLSIHPDGSDENQSLKHFVALAQERDDCVAENGFWVMDSASDEFCNTERIVEYEKVSEVFACPQIQQCDSPKHECYGDFCKIGSDE